MQHTLQTSHTIQPAVYYRKSKKWPELVGKTGTIRQLTQVCVAPKELEAFLPYYFLLIELENGEKIEVMGEAQTTFAENEKIRLELRKNSIANSESVIEYGIKACKL